MQVELIGCTSAGKSTLLAAITDVARADNVPLTHGNDFALRQIGAARVPVGVLRTVLIHLVAIFGCATSLFRHLQFVKFAWRTLRRSGIPLRQQLNQLRKVLKQLGRFEMIRRRITDQEIVIVDESTVHAAHNLFVHSHGEPDAEAIAEFAALVPLPDYILYVAEAEEVIVDRVLERGHPRLPDPTLLLVTAFVHTAIATFDRVSMDERMQAQSLVIRNGHLITSPNSSDPRLLVFIKLLQKAIAKSGESHVENSETPSTSYTEILS